MTDQKPTLTLSLFNGDGDVLYRVRLPYNSAMYNLYAHWTFEEDY